MRTASERRAFNRHARNARAWAEAVIAARLAVIDAEAKGDEGSADFFDRSAMTSAEAGMREARRAYNLPIHPMFQ